MIIVNIIFLVGASFAWGSDDEWIVISDDDKCEDRVASREGHLCEEQPPAVALRRRSPESVQILGFPGCFGEGDRELLVPLLEQVAYDEEQGAIREAEVAGGGARCHWQRDVDDICIEALRCCRLVGKYISRCCSCFDER